MPTPLALPRRPRRDRGTALVFATSVVILLASLTLALSQVDVDGYRQARSSARDLRMRCTAEAAVAEAAAILEHRGVAALAAVSWPRTAGPTTYWADVTHGDADALLADDLVRIVGVAEEEGERTAVEALYRRVGTPRPSGVLALARVRLDVGAMVDSYDSSEGPYSPVSSLFGMLFVRAEAQVGAGSAVEIDGGFVFGDVATGPSGTVSTLNGGQVTGTAVPAAEAPAIDPVAVPAASAPDTNWTVLGTRSLGPGTYRYRNLDVAALGRLQVTGPAVLVVDNLDLGATSRIVADTSAGDVEIYALGDVDLGTGAQVRTSDGRPDGLTLYGGGGVCNFDLAAAAEFHGTIVAPAARVRLGLGASLLGAVHASEVELGVDAQLHVDEALAAPEMTPGPAQLARLSWFVLSHADAAALARP